MKLAFASNFMNHHQLPLSDALANTEGVDYRFIATEPFNQGEVSVGYCDSNRSRAYILRPYESDAQKAEALRFCTDADVVIIGSAPEEYVKERIKAGKLTFRYCERFFRNGKWRILDPRVLWSVYRSHIRYRRSELLMLCASAYTAEDCRFLGAYPNKTYRWGYFPEVPAFDADAAIERKNREPLKILWTGRFLALKHPEDALLTAKRLVRDGVNFTLTMRGQGELLEQMKDMAVSLGLSEKVFFPGATSPEEVQAEMRNADIFLFTSDRQEGWGAVLNESMANACAVVANHEIGSVPFVIEDGENGLIYDRCDRDSLYEKVKFLADRPEERKRLQKNACETMRKVWNANAAAERLLCLIDCVQTGKETPYGTGPCSRAK